MSEQVKRYDGQMMLGGTAIAAGFKTGMVTGRDYDALHAEAEALRAENDRLHKLLDKDAAVAGHMQSIVERQRGEHQGLASFFIELFDGAVAGGSFDGGDIQDAGVRHGLLVVDQRKESCGEHCDCSEYGFPAECYRLTPALATHRAQQGEQP